MKPHSAQEYADWKDHLYSRTRILIAEDPESFTLAGNLLAQTFSNEFIRALDEDNPESPLHGWGPDIPHSPRLGWAPERLLVTRICYARSAAIGQSEEHLIAKLDFRFTGKIKERLSAARQSILAILLAADPDANDFISAEICELALLQYETTDPQILGRGFVPWNWDEKEVHLCPGLAHYDCPTLLALTTLEAACTFIESKTETLIPQHPSVSSETIKSATNKSFSKLVKLEEKNDIPPQRHHSPSGIVPGCTVSSLAELIRRNRGTVRIWAKKASPPVSKRIKGQPYTREELIRISSSALQRGDLNAANQLKDLANNDQIG